MSIERPRSATDYTIEKLACSRLKAVKDLNLDGWSELTDTGLKVKNQCQRTKVKTNQTIETFRSVIGN